MYKYDEYTCNFTKKINNIIDNLKEVYFDKA